jgi:hypothetical protein
MAFAQTVWWEEIMKRLGMGILGVVLLAASPAWAAKFNCSNLTGPAKRCKDEMSRMQRDYLACMYRADTLFDRHSCIRENNQISHEYHAGTCGLPDFRHVIHSCATPDEQELSPNLPVANHNPAIVQWANSGPVIQLQDAYGNNLFPNQAPAILAPRPPDVMTPIR